MPGRVALGLLQGLATLRPLTVASTGDANQWAVLQKHTDLEVISH